MADPISGFYAQFGRPVGFPGWLAGKLMSSREGNKRRNTWTVDLLAIGPSDLVLEIGYGPGLGIEQAVAKATRGLVVGFDHSDVMHGQALKRNRKANDMGGLLLRTGPLEAAAQLGIRFDKAFCSNVAQFWPDPDAALAEFKKLLKPGGRLAVTYQPAGRGAKAADADHFVERWRGLLSANGFRNVQVERLAHLKPTPAICLLAYA